MEIKRAEYFRNALRDVIKVNAIYTIHYFRYGKKFSYPLESHPFWELVYVDSGELHVTAGNKKFVMKQGEACFHSPDLPHTVETKGSFANSVIVSFEATGRMMNFFENKVFSLDGTEKNLLSSLVWEGKKSFDGRLDDADQTKMVKKTDAPFGSEQLIKNVIELLLISLVRNNFESLSVKGADNNVSVHAEQIVESVIEILKSKITESVTLDEISEKMFFSKTYIKAVFKKYTGTSVIKYFNRLKIEQAKKLISTNRYTITEITETLGFSSVHYFSRLFKATTDMSPSEYAKSIKADNVLQ